MAVSVLSGCSDDGEKPVTAPPATMLAPGKPGEPNQTITAGPTPAKPPSAPDVEFVQKMIPHHQQALEMSALAPARASSAKVKSLASRINVAQAGEIKLMRDWLGRNKILPETHAHTMPGMATSEDMAKLKAAGGAAFDELYLQLMIKHHEGALVMADQVLPKGTDVIVIELAKEVVASQRAEINRMKDLLDA